MAEYQQSRILIRVISNKDKERMYAVDPNACIYTLKQSQVEAMQFLLNNSVLDQNKTFNDYEIKEGDTIYCYIAIPKTRENALWQEMKIQQNDFIMAKAFANHNSTMRALKAFKEMQEILPKAQESKIEILKPKKPNGPCTSPIEWAS